MTATTLTANLRSAGGNGASAYERMRARAPKSEPTTARVRTRKMGISIGGFGLTYTAKDLELDQDKTTLPSGFASLDPECSPEYTPDRHQASSSAKQAATNQLQPANTSPLNVKRGQSAYAAQVQRYREESVPRSVLLSVV